MAVLAATAAIALDDLVSCNCCSMDGIGDGAAASTAAKNKMAFISAIAATAASVLTASMAAWRL